MGHLFRALNLRAELEAGGAKAEILVNTDAPALATLRARNARFRVVDLTDDVSDWEGAAVRELGARWWIDDRLGTTASHARRVKAAGARLATFDDDGDGAALADLHFAPMRGDEATTPTVLCGLRYLVLNPEIEKFRRLRAKAGSLVVSLGGSDTYGATVRVVAALKAAGKTATVVVGPAFRHDAQLREAAGDCFTIKQSVPSLPEEFSRHDAAITGGGITAFEAAAAGLPAVVVANEPWEEAAGRRLESLGAAVYAGPHDRMDTTAFSRELDIERMSRAALAAVDLSGARNVRAALEAHE